jgi:hypothetical protein
MPVASTEAGSFYPQPQDDDSNVDARIPMESYSSRQKSLSFLGQLLDRWK